MTRPIIAAQLYTVREQMRTPEQIAEGLGKIRAIGYPSVQVSGIGEIAPELLKEMLDREQLTVCATHVPWRRLQQDLDNLIAEHKLLGCDHVGLGAMPGEYRQDREGWVRFAREADAIARKIKDQGLQFIYHNHAFEFQKFDGITCLEVLIEETNPDAFHFELDTYWIQAGGGNPVTWIEKVAGRMKVVHFKDMGNAGDNLPIMTEVGEGNLEWPKIIAACQRIGVEYAAVEQDICQRDPFESLAISYRNLKLLGL
ncbi:MAG TPA: sugar phosphate isomerase/epimerase [Firmicutes bacterium]|nr:sugar phosphate isomerase/epimerase [Bacillota bacterium]